MDFVKANNRSPLLVFSDDWGRHPSSCQHLMRQYLGRYDVHWVNTIGTRTPHLDWATLRRGWGKARQWLRAAPLAARSESPCVHHPKMWPWFSSRLDRWINRRVFGRQLRTLCQSLGRDPVAVTTIPIVADVMDRLPAQRWIYYCVDDFSQWPGLDQRALGIMEERLVRRADSIVAVSENLQERMKGLGRTAHLLTHGVDLDFWAKPESTLLPIAGLGELERPLIVFWGVVDRRMDVGFVRQLANDLSQGTILLLGPEADPDPELRTLQHVVRWSPLRFEQLPHLAKEADVLIMPYADLPVTHAMQPLKLKEYLASGKPAVVRDLPANRAWADCLDLASTPSSFSEVVRTRIRTGLPESQKVARKRLATESWVAKAAVFESILNGDRQSDVAC